MTVVTRRPALPEDEGRHQFVASFPMRSAALKWIAAQKGEYFGPSDYYTAATKAGVE